MKIVVFGLSISSSWGNGHATLWRGLCSALARDGHVVVFFEKNTPFYAASRDMSELNGGSLCLYDNWREAAPLARDELIGAEAAIVTSYCPDAVAATELIVSDGHPLTIFYDLDTPVTLSHLATGAPIPYIGARGLNDFDLVLSYTGGGALDALRTRLGARRVAPLYGHVDPALHRPVVPREHYRCDLSYLGTYSADRQAALSRLLLAPADQHPDLRFIIGGAQYPADFPWYANIHFVRHLPPSEHPAFFSSSRLTLNVTRKPMADMGWCPSGRLFEAAACGAPMISDCWAGLDDFFTPGEEILVAHDTDDVITAIETSDEELRRMAAAARERVLAEHTSARRARELIAAMEAAAAPPRELERA